MSGLIYLSIAIVLGLGFIFFAVQMMRKKDNQTAMRTFGYSIIYLMLIFAALLIDHYFRFTVS
jgi:protoheme IX farnesyltransferase